MRRRAFLGVAATLTGMPLAGCLGNGTEATPTPSPTSSPTRQGTPTQASGLGTIEYTVVNEDDEPHDVAVTMANAEGRVVQETFEPSLGPGASVSSGSAGEPPENSPFELTFEVDDVTETYRWDVRECGRIDLRVTIRDGGSVDVERTLCQN